VPRGSCVPGRLWRRRRHWRGCHRSNIRALQHDEGGPYLNLIAGSNLDLVHTGTIDDGAGFVAEIDERDVIGRCNLDDRVHARGELVVHPEVALRVLADFDDVLRDRLTARELIAFVEPEREGNLRFTLHRFPSSFLLAYGCFPLARFFVATRESKG